jgi:hypothetical protein
MVTRKWHFSGPCLSPVHTLSSLQSKRLCWKICSWPPRKQEKLGFLCPLVIASSRPPSLATSLLWVLGFVSLPQKGKEEEEEKERKGAGRGRYRLNPPDPTYFSQGSHRIQDLVHLCEFDLIWAETLRHHRTVTVSFHMQEGSVGGWLSKEGLN